MATIRRNLVYAAIDRARALSRGNGLDRLERYEFQKQMILDDESLTKDERTFAMKGIAKDYDSSKVLRNKGTKRFCEECQQECLAILYCEHCVRTYLRNKFSNWTSGNNDIDDLIQTCQIKSLKPDYIIEWIPYNRIQNIEYLTKGGCSEIYSARWINGPYDEWDSNEQNLKRFGSVKVILKQLENVESADKSWFDEAKSHLTMGNKSSSIVHCHGLTQNPSNGNYMLVMRLMITNLRKYLQQHQIIWKEKIDIAYQIIKALERIHEEKAIHRDLHSGNILFRNTKWRISDFGFCGPADKPLKSIYGNLPYIAPEVIVGKSYTFASDIYSFGILMWEISSRKLPFDNYEHNYDLVMRIVNGMRPKIIPGTPAEYKKLMIQCWDANPLNRPDARSLYKKIKKMWQDSYKDNINEFNTLEHTTSASSSSLTNLSSSSKLYSLSTSSLYQFENLPEPRNATEEEQEAFHSNPCDFSIPDNIESLYSKGQDNLEISEDFSEGLKGLNLNKDDS